MGAKHISADTIIGLASLVVGVAGFAVTLHQLSKIKTAADAARSAADSTKVKITQLDLVQESKKAELAISNLRRGLVSFSAAEWENSHIDLEEAIIVIAENFKSDEIGSKPKIEQASKQMASLAAYAHPDRRKSDADQDRVRDSLRAIRGALVMVQTHVQRNQ